MGFKFDGILSKDKKIKARILNWQVIQPLRNFYETVPGREGVLDFGAESAERMIEISCSIFPENNFTDLVSVLDNISVWLNPKNGLKQLILDDIPDRYFMARVSEEVDCERVLRSAGNFTINFICPDPYGYAVDDEVYTILETGIIERLKGNVYSEPIYSLKAVINGNITISINGETMKIIEKLMDGEILIIDVGKVTAKVVDDTGILLRNGLPGLEELNFPVLNPGINEIEIAAENSTLTELKIYSKSRWR